MPKKRNYILTVGGFDPSGGAGILADIKTFEEHKLLGMAVNTANTVQTEDRFISVNWISESLIFDQLDTLLAQYRFPYLKIGLVPSFEMITEIHNRVKDHGTRIIWDPVLKASAGFDMQHDLNQFEKALSSVYFLTPNWDEIQTLTGMTDSIQAASAISKHCNVYLKGGHNPDDPGRDTIFYNGTVFNLRPKSTAVHPKHGSGCILSSALAANLTKGYPVHRACQKSKTYVTKVLESNVSLLGYHKG